MGLGLVAVLAILLFRLRPSVPESPDQARGAPPLEVRSAALPEAPREVVPLPASLPPPSRARSAFDRMLAALRSGDREKVKAALEVLRVELVPPPVPDAENAALLYRKAFELYPNGLDERETDLVSKLSDGRALTAEG